MVAKVTDPLGVEDEGLGLLTRTKTFRDRVQAGGGSIEDGSLENLYDPILRAIKGFSGVGPSDLVLFVSASAVENNSGSIPTLFDASGGENDATQTDTAKQPTLKKDGIGGRWEANGDGNDDRLRIPSEVADAFESGSKGTVMSVVRYKSPSNYEHVFSLDDGAPYWLIRCNSIGDITTFVDDGSTRKKAIGSNPSFPATLVHSGRYNGSEIVVRENGVQTGLRSASLGDSTYTGKEYLMSRDSGNRLKGAFACTIAFGTPLSDTQLSEIEDKANTYYDNIY